jgi:hypothetical protein
MVTSFLPPGVHPALAGKPFFPANRDKRPAVKEWRPFADRLPTEQEIASWKNHPGPWGMPCGPLSFAVLDFDGPEGRKIFEEKYSDTDLPPVAGTPSGGYHAFYSYPNGEIAKLLKNAVRILPGVDIRCHGGYVIIPSAYGDGRCWIQAPDIPAPELPEWIIEALKKQSTPTATPGPSSEPDGLPPGVGQGERNATVARLAGRYLAPPKNLSPEEATAILARWNLKNSPPLPEEEIRSVVFSIARKEREKSPLIEVLSYQDLAAKAAQTRAMAIAPFFPAGGKGYLPGTGGVGKTLLALNIAVAVSQELPVFGRFQATSGRVLYVDAESTEALTHSRLRKICAGLGVPPTGIDFVFPSTKLDLGTDRGRDGLSKKIDECRASFLFLDSFLCFGNLRNENDNVEVRNYLEGLKPITARTGVSIVILDHAAKASAEQMKAGISLTARGAGSKRDWCDMMITFEEKKNDAKFLRILRFNKTRFCAPIPAITLEMDTSFVFRVAEDDATCPVFSIRQVVEDSPGIGATKLYDALSGMVGCSKRTAMRGVADAVKIGYIRREERSKFVTFHPVLVTNGDVTNNGDEENGEGKHLVYQ